jgi:hypothetical protein
MNTNPTTDITYIATITMTEGAAAELTHELGVFCPTHPIRGEACPVPYFRGNRLLDQRHIQREVELDKGIHLRLDL